MRVRVVVGQLAVTEGSAVITIIALPGEVAVSVRVVPVSPLMSEKVVISLATRDVAREALQEAPVQSKSSRETSQVMTTVSPWVLVARVRFFTRQLCQRF